MSKQLNEIQRELVDFALSLGDTLVLQDNPTYPSIFREPRIGKIDNRICGVEMLENSIKIHLPKNRAFRTYFQSKILWSNAFSDDSRNYTFLNFVDGSEKRMNAAKDLIKYAYKMIDTNTI